MRKGGKEKPMTVIYTNMPALISMRNLNTTATMFTKAVERLSSGLRINHAADDAAGLSIAMKMQAQKMGLDQAVRNSQDAISMIQTAEGGMQVSQEMVKRMRELAVQASNDTLTSVDRDAIKLELDQLKLQIDDISNQTTFNSQKLLDGTRGSGATVDSAASTLVPGAGTAATLTVNTVDVSHATGGNTYTLTYTAPPIPWQWMTATGTAQP